MNRTKIIMEEEDIPTHYYNIMADLPFGLEPPLHPATKQPLTPKDLEPLFPKELIRQEASMERYIKIPDEVRELYKLYRPTPLIRAKRLERALKTKARIYFKYEGCSPTGAHKVNTALPQAYYSKQEGVKRLTTETGAGQWGSALAFACSMFGLKCQVYMVKASYEQKPYRKVMMETFGAAVEPSPSTKTNAGRAILKQTPQTPGSLGIAISEAVEDAATHKDTKYSLGSVLNHVLMHQTIIGQEVRKQLAKANESADYIIGCIGGGSNFAGLAFPFVKDKLDGAKIEFVTVEPTACPSLTRGEYKYDFGDTAKLTPLLKMYTLGHTFMPAPIHAGGLRYHGMAPLVSLLHNKGIIRAVAYGQLEVFKAAMLFANTEGIIPAPETAHAIKAVVDIARQCTEPKNIVFNFSGHGYLDLGAYDAFLHNKLIDSKLPADDVTICESTNGEGQ
ncbi:MAG: TrpB-like pyridoxal phosphate-dependent enzyme [Candidatus Woesearchaeota archaeon]